MGPLTGIKVIEMNAIGPVPHAGMQLADMGAEVVVIDRPAEGGQSRPFDCSRRGKKSIALDLKTNKGLTTALSLISRADILIEGFRPGVMERFGLGPQECFERNESLVYGRMTGWGQEGPLSSSAGHDINYIALTGVLHAIGRKEDKPVPPLNLVGDFGGGSMYLISGVLSAYISVLRTGRGQVVDAAMTDGSASLMAMSHSLQAMNMWTQERGSNMLDSGAHFYNTYETKDGKYIAIGAIEPKFYRLLAEKMDLDPTLADHQYNTLKWEEMHDRFSDLFKTRTRKEWCDLLEGTDACFAPVLSLSEAPDHPHNKSRNTYIIVDGMIQPAPAPRFSTTVSKVRHGAHIIGGDTEEVMRTWGVEVA